MRMRTDHPHTIAAKYHPTGCDNQARSTDSLRSERIWGLGLYTHLQGSYKTWHHMVDPYRPRNTTTDVGIARTDRTRSDVNPERVGRKTGASPPQNCFLCVQSKRLRGSHLVGCATYRPFGARGTKQAHIGNQRSLTPARLTCFSVRP